MIQIVHSHVKNLDLIAAIPVMLLVMMVSFVHIVYKFGGKEIFVFTRKFVFIINYLMFLLIIIYNRPMSHYPLHGKDKNEL